ncbi:uncharacterized protein CBL_20657, partial [Carabus blaptoides fortunei]
GTSKMFTTGLSIQIALKLIFNLHRIVAKPRSIKQIFFKRDVSALASFLAGFTGTFRLTYNMGIESGHVPQVPGFTKILYCFSTAILFHAGIIEPNNLRPSYYKFLHNLSGG